MPLPTIHVLLATYNGAPFLREQWASLEAQEGVSLVVHIADDGSADGTVELLEELAQSPRGAIQAVHWVRAAPRRSATRSFLLLVAEAVRGHPEAQWFAYCDQDDVWLPGKLAAALDTLKPHEGGRVPLLYGGRTLAMDENGRQAGLSRLFRGAPSFRNAMAQNIMGGNTMLMNRAAAELVAASASLDVVTHDWLTYQLVTGAGGLVQYDPRPFVHYRQHSRNVIGSNLGWRARWHRLLRMLRGEYKDWNRLQVAALSARANLLTAPNREVLEAFRRARQAPTPWARVIWLRRSGVFRQNPAEQAMLLFACLLRRF